MWNENAPLELLKDMPKTLSDENLIALQEVIDKDKYINSCQLGRDLCGSYAPFCENCNKYVKYPCAVAYVKMKIAEGMEIDVVETPIDREEKPAKKRIRIAIARRKR